MSSDAISCHVIQGLSAIGQQRRVFHASNVMHERMRRNWPDRGMRAAC